MTQHIIEHDFRGQTMQKQLSNFVFERCLFDQHTDFTKTQLSKAEFYHCDLNGVDFTVAGGMMGAIIRNSTLENVSFFRKKLEDVQVIETTLIKCDLSKSHLKSALFQKVRSITSNFSWSDWYNARFTECIFDSCQIDHVQGAATSHVVGCQGLSLELLKRAGTRTHFGDDVSYHRFMFGD